MALAESTELHSSALHDIVARFGSVSVLVVGDLILDKYTIGKPTRISREAPVAVLEFTREYAVPGGGTNPACTVASLGGRAYLAGVVGDDQAGQELKAELEGYGVDLEGLVVDYSRPTITKKRIVAQVTPSMLQQVARIDHIDRTPISGDVERALIAAIERLLPGCDAVLASNYKSGTLTPAVVERTRQLAHAERKILAVDSQGDLSLFHRFGIVKCNQPEAEDALRRPLTTEADFKVGLADLVAQLEAQVVIVTRSAEGISLMTNDGQYCHIPVSNTSEVFDVTGAGDTVIALLTLAIAAGAGILDAARLANYGAGVVVRKWGNAVLQPDELLAALSVV
ncbi:MAG TPA: bifunctional ADP-heptose synthase [Chloroflexia bacterium]|nr:bifunctional ADP-heptose synthase [Chloroflexia bacterium]